MAAAVAVGRVRGRERLCVRYLDAVVHGYPAGGLESEEKVVRVVQWCKSCVPGAARYKERM